MSPMTMLLIAWACLTAVLVVLLIYRSTLTMHEDDQLFLSDAEAQLQSDQNENNRRIAKITPYVRGLGAISAVLILAIAALWIYSAVNQASGLQ
jgi:hypothetical protein